MSNNGKTKNTKTVRSGDHAVHLHRSGVGDGRLWSVWGAVGSCDSEKVLTSLGWRKESHESKAAPGTMRTLWREPGTQHIEKVVRVSDSEEIVLRPSTTDPTKWILWDADVSEHKAKTCLLDAGWSICSYRISEGSGPTHELWIEPKREHHVLDLDVIEAAEFRKDYIRHTAGVLLAHNLTTNPGGHKMTTARAVRLAVELWEDCEKRFEFESELERIKP